MRGDPITKMGLSLSWRHGLHSRVECIFRGSKVVSTARLDRACVEIPPAWLVDLVVAGATS
eukprot:1431604-Pyramimonas_sp.AAC.1